MVVGGLPAPLAALLLATLLVAALAGCSSAPGATSHPASATGGAGAGAAGTLTLVTLGASDAYGVGTYDPDRLNWPAQLAQALPQPTRLVNLGIPGATLSQARREELPIALDQRPSVVVIWLAVNDIIAHTPLDTYSQELRATLATLRTRAPGARVFVGNVPDLTQVPYFADRDPVGLRAQVNAWNAAIAQDCAAEGATLADLYNGWGQLGEHPDYISSDGLHPSTLGAQELADYFDILIRRSLPTTGGAADARRSRAVKGGAA